MQDTARRLESSFEDARELHAPSTDPRFHRHAQRRPMLGGSVQAMAQEQGSYNQAERWRRIAFDSVRQIVNDYQWSVIQQKNKDDSVSATVAFSEALVQAFLLGQKSVNERIR